MDRGETLRSFFMSGVRTQLDIPKRRQLAKKDVGVKGKLDIPKREQLVTFKRSNFVSNNANYHLKKKPKILLILLDIIFFVLLWPFLNSLLHSEDSNSSRSSKRFCTPHVWFYTERQKKQKKAHWIHSPPLKMSKSNSLTRLVTPQCDWF